MPREHHAVGMHQRARALESERNVSGRQARSFRHPEGCAEMAGRRGSIVNRSLLRCALEVRSGAPRYGAVFRPRQMEEVRCEQRSHASRTTVITPVPAERPKDSLWSAWS